MSYINIYIYIHMYVTYAVADEYDTSSNSSDWPDVFERPEFGLTEFKNVWSLVKVLTLVNFCTWEMIWKQTLFEPIHLKRTFVGVPHSILTVSQKTTLETIFAKATILSNESKDKQLDTFKVWFDKRSNSFLGDVTKFGNSQPGSVNVGSGLSLTSGLNMGQDTFWDTPMTLDHWSIVIPQYTEHGIGCPQKTKP